ncbi:MAG: hypothetical protein FD144_2638 [Rhodospirillaceae bacterium]|nr:MAG: hypothetical protein FD144_2638 [Rhodospirillaceae bacterium]
MSGQESTRNKFRGRTVSVALENTYDLATAWGAALRNFAPQALAKRLGISPRTIENWKDGEHGPTWRHTVAMLRDDELCKALLEAAGRGDLAKHQETIAALKRALVSEGK